MRTDLSSDIPNRPRRSPQGSIKPITLMPASVPFPNVLRNDSYTCLPYVQTCWAHSFEPACPDHSDAADSVLTDSMNQRANFALQLTCTKPSAVMSLALVRNDNLNISK